MIKNILKIAGIAVVGLIALLVVAGLFGGSNEPAKVPSEGNSSETETKPDETLVAGIGDTLKNDDFEVTLNSVSYTDKDTLGDKPENSVFAILDITVVNLTDEAQTFSSIIGVALRDADGYNGELSFFVDKKGNLDGDIPAGGKLRGQIVFDIGDGPYELTVSPNFLGDGFVFKFEK